MIFNTQLISLARIFFFIHRNLTKQNASSMVMSIGKITNFILLVWLSLIVRMYIVCIVLLNRISKRTTKIRYGGFTKQLLNKKQKISPIDLELLSDRLAEFRVQSRQFTVFTAI